MTTTIIIAVLAAAVLLLLYSIVSHRRRILALNVDPESLPDICHGLTQIAGLTGAVVFSGNKVQIFQDGTLLRQMMDDIADAKHTIHFETYIWRRGRLEVQLVDLLCRKAHQGVKVRVIIDALGAIQARDTQLKRLQNCGAEVAHYRHFKGLDFYHFNNRMHRKLLIVDGNIAYTCGHGVADEWLGKAQNRHHWRDTGARVTGPVVHSFQSTFTQDWCATSTQVPLGDGCFPEQETVGDVQAHVVKSSTKSTDSSVALFYMMAIASAKREIIIQNPYFIPDGQIPDLLIKKAQSGVDVHLMLPGKHNDSQIVRLAGRRLYQRLLQAGVRIYEFSPTMLHQKVVVIDAIWSHVGTTNFDLRSLALNAEFGVGLLSESIAEELRDAFYTDLERSSTIDLERWQRRAWSEKMLEWLAFQLRGQI